MNELALAVSGGSDSIALMHLVRRWSRAHAPHLKLHALTVDHQLRAGSEDEAVLVGQWCAGLGIPHHILKWTGEKPATGIQARARTARYDLMTAWCAAHDVSTLATGHTANDQAETVFMRQQRTQSAKSLAGIWPELNWGGIRIMRPLLEITREHLRAELREEEIIWVDDPSNEDERFERVRVRRKLQDESDVKRVAAIADAARDYHLQSVEAQRDWLSKFAKIEATGLIYLPREHLCEAGGELAANVLSWAVTVAGSGLRPAPPAIQRLIKRCLGGELGRRTLSGAIVALRKNAILVGREPGRMPQDVCRIGPAGTLIWDGRFQVKGPPGTSISPAGMARPAAKTELPAFVLASLPVVENGTGVRIFPHFDPECDLVVELCERFRA